MSKELLPFSECVFRFVWRFGKPFLFLQIFWGAAVLYPLVAVLFSKTPPAGLNAALTEAMTNVCARLSLFDTDLWSLSTFLAFTIGAVCAAEEATRKYGPKQD